MKKIKLNSDQESVKPDGFRLDANEEYVVNIRDELDTQAAILSSTLIVGLPALKDYHKWLELNGFDSNVPNPTNRVVGMLYGKETLWKTKMSQGLAVRAEDDDDYYIIMECSGLVEGFRGTQIILTLGGCM